MKMTLNAILSAHRRLLRPEFAQKFTGKKFLGSFRPGVYLVLKNGRVLYVGKCSHKLIKRAAATNNAALDRATALHLLPCKNPKAAESLERILIHELKPKYNKRLKY